MSVSSHQPLCPPSEVDVEGSLEGASDALVGETQVYTPRRFVPSLFGVVTLLALYVAGHRAPGSSWSLGAAPALSRAYNIDSQQLHSRITHGLRRATCPRNVSDKSEGAQVTLDAIKAFIGAERTDEVEFWWVYPDPNATGRDNESDWSAEEQFSISGGYMYSWADQSVCLALLPTGSDLSFAPSLTLPTAGISWHKPAGDTIYDQYAWICPSCDPSCVHGCFIYKSSVGKTSAFRVV